MPNFVTVLLDHAKFVTVLCMAFWHDFGTVWFVKVFSTVDFVMVFGMGQVVALISMVDFVKVFGMEMISGIVFVTVLNLT